MKNYKLIEEKYLDNEQSTALVYEHIETKAKVFVLSNEDQNKLFGIGFRTPPKTSDGVCHIIEHCVLNGSKKYRTKEPFMDMIKGSLYTFLNAMTYPDKTIYPVASRNDKDFKNLTDVYLDAVFNPIVKENEKIFRQEGWRYNLEDDNLTYKGVVYNEMRGAMSSPESQVVKNINNELFPDSIYGLNSGGDPYVIPSLTYNEFLDYYNEFYHPTNSYIFLYGNMDYEEYLEYIHEDYLSNYEYREVDSKIDFQKPFDKTKDSTRYYNTTKEENPKESFISYSAIVGKGSDSKDRIISNILSDALIDNESSPLRQKLLSLGILDVIFSVSQTNLEATFSILAKNIDIKDKDLFINTIEEELEKIVEEGIDKDLIQTQLNDYKFNILEKENYPTKGIIYFTNSFDSWLYDKSPIEAIDLRSDLEYIEENIDNRIFEDFIKERILNSKNKSIVSHIAKKGLNENRDKDLQDKLDDKLNSLSEEEKEDLINFRKEMDKFQNKENTAEEKATIPMLEKTDVDTKVERINRKVIEKEDYTYIKHNLPTFGIDYISVLFDIDHIVEKEDIMYLSLLTYAISMLDTKHYDYSTLNKKIYLNTGGISADISQYRNDKTKDIKRKLVLKTKTFSDNIEDAIEIFIEVITNTIFENESRLKEIISMIKANNEMGLFQSAHLYMMNRALSNHIEYLKYNEYVKGIDFHKFIEEISNNKLNEILDKLKEVFNKSISKNNLIIDVTSTFENKDNLDKSIDKLANSFTKKEIKKSTFNFTPKQIKEGFKTSADVNYVSLGNELKEEYNSKYKVLNNLVSNEYLYGEIRAKGGAYGAGMITSEPNNFGTYSYRDPNIEKTLKTYENIPTFIDNTKVDDNDLLPVIIGAVGKLNPPRTEKAKAGFDLSLYISEREYDEIDELIENALDTDINFIKSKSNILKDTIESSSLAVLGNSNVIEENKELFDNIIEL